MEVLFLYTEDGRSLLRIGVNADQRVLIMIHAYPARFIPCHAILPKNRTLDLLSLTAQRSAIPKVESNIDSRAHRGEY